MLYKQMYKSVWYDDIVTKTKQYNLWKIRRKSMIRIINPAGKLQYVNQVQPVCEKQIMFNGRRIVIMEPAKDLSVEATALALRIAETSQTEQPFFSEELQIGNLKPEKVLEIVHVLGEKGYYDFSTLNYQNAKEYNQVVWDNGESDAYCNCTLKSGMLYFCSQSMGPCFPLEKSADLQMVDCLSDSADTDWDSIF